MALNIQLFNKRLKAAIAWTNHLAEGFDLKEENYGNVFRVTNPTVGNKPAFDNDNGYVKWNVEDNKIDNYINILTSALGRRNMQIDVTDFHLLGRILMIYPLLPSHFGATMWDSNLFFDERNFPPVDTWFYLEQEPAASAVLYCWIPRGFEHVVERGLDEDDVGTYSWLDKHPDIYQEVRRQFGLPPTLYHEKRYRPDNANDTFEMIYKNNPENLEAALQALKDKGLNTLMAVKVVRYCLDTTLGEAYEMVNNSAAFKK